MTSLGLMMGVRRLPNVGSGFSPRPDTQHVAD